MRRHSDPLIRPKDPASIRDRQFFLANMHAVSTAGNRDIRPVVHDETRWRITSQLSNHSTGGDQLPIAQRFITELNEIDFRFDECPNGFGQLGFLPAIDGELAFLSLASFVPLATVDQNINRNRIKRFVRS